MLSPTRLKHCALATTLTCLVTLSAAPGAKFQLKRNWDLMVTGARVAHFRNCVRRQFARGED